MYTNQRQAVTPNLIERSDVVRIEDGTLVVNCDEYFEGGSSQLVTLKVTSANEIHFERLITPVYPSEIPVRHAAGSQIDAFLAMHIRKTAMPLLTNPKDNVADGVDLMIAAAVQCIPMRPVLTLVVN